MRTSAAIARTLAVPLRNSSPGYFALVMGTGIVAVGARLLAFRLLAWPLFVIALTAYVVLWAILLARMVCFPAAVLEDFASHRRGPDFLTIVAATGVIGIQLQVFDTLPGLLPVSLWLAFVLWCVIVYGLLGTLTVVDAKPGLAGGLSGAWLLFVVATESLAVLCGALASRGGATPPLIFAALAFYLLGAMLYIWLTSLILLRWMFHPMRAEHMDASWWINMGAVAIATLAGAQLMSLRGAPGDLAALLGFVAPFTALMWVTSTFWIPLLLILFVWKGLKHEWARYDPRQWSAVFPLGMYVAATDSYARVAKLPFLAWIPRVLFWIALLAWTWTFIGMWWHFLRAREPAHLASWKMMPSVKRSPRRTRLTP